MEKRSSGAGNVLPGEHVEELARRLYLRAFMILQPLGAWGVDGFVQADDSLSEDGRRAAREALTVLTQALDEARELEDAAGLGTSPAFDVRTTLEVLVSGVTGALSGASPVPAGAALVKLSLSAQERWEGFRGAPSVPGSP